MFRIVIQALVAIAVVTLISVPGMAQETALPQASTDPLPVGAGNFSALMEHSPFTRSLNLSDSLILTGVATVDDQQIATVLDRNTKQTYVVSSTPNAQGWKLTGLDGSTNLDAVTAMISVDGSSMVKVRYDELKLKNGEGKPAGSAITEPGKGDPSDVKNGAGDDIRAKMMTLSEEQRGKVMQKMMELREKHPEMSREERGEHMKKIMDKYAAKDRK